jgi:uncharacterized protein
MEHRNVISLETVLDEPLRFEFTQAIPLSAIDREPLVSLSPVRVSAEVARIDHGYALDAALSYSGELECSRCLAAYPFAVDDAFSIVLCPRGPAGDDETSLEKGDLDVSFYDDPVVPVEPIVEERIQILLPMKPLCREDCKGLCPQCGEDWNARECGCVAGTADPRWDALRTLKQKA